MAELPVNRLGSESSAQEDCLLGEVGAVPAVGIGPVVQDGEAVNVLVGALGNKTKNAILEATLYQSQ